jgi:hypothetical protein
MSTVNDIPEQYLECRDLMHSWQPYDAKMLRSPVTGQREIHRVLRCIRCQTLKTQRLTPRGDIIAHSYSYAEHYLLKGGRLPRAERGRLRRVNADRWIREHSE